MTIQLNGWLTLVQLGVLAWILLDIFRTRRWTKRCDYWRDLTTRELELAIRARTSGDMQAFERHWKAKNEYQDQWQKHLRRK